jgi:hypothetical protein
MSVDHYEIYYADKLWNLLPAIYRSEDSSEFGVNGPLREMVNRIGAQATVLRRSIDRLWEDQSIETCDDWVVPYIADLLATRRVASQNARGQRLDVAKTIYYRRRSGTVAILEEIASDVTGWDARVGNFPPPGTDAPRPRSRDWLPGGDCGPRRQPHSATGRRARRTLDQHRHRWLGRSAKRARRAPSAVAFQYWRGHPSPVGVR